MKFLVLRYSARSSFTINRVSKRLIEIWQLGIFLLCSMFLGGHTFSQTAVSFKFGEKMPMAATDMAGAEVRVANWNFMKGVSEGNVTTFDTINDQDGKVVPGLTVSIVGGHSTKGLFDWSDAPALNEAALFNGAYDQNDGGPTFITVTGIPFAKYDVYFYRCNDNEAADKRAGSFQIGDVTYYIRGGLPNPDVDGTRYVRSTAKSATSPIDQGNYVKFEGLTGPKMEASIVALDAGDSAMRNKVCGFQIVEVK